MAVANEALANQAPPHSPIDLGSLSIELDELRSADPAVKGFGAEIYAAAIVMQAGELRNSFVHHAVPDTTGPQIAELLSNLVLFAGLCGVDIVEATSAHREILRDRAARGRPQLRGI